MVVAWRNDRSGVNGVGCGVQGIQERLAFDVVEGGVEGGVVLGVQEFLSGGAVQECVQGLGEGMAFAGGFVDPQEAGFQVALDAFTVQVGASEPAHGVGVEGFGGAFEPGDGVGGAVGDEEQDAEVALGGGVAAVGVDDDGVVFGGDGEV